MNRTGGRRGAPVLLVAVMAVALAACASPSGEAAPGPSLPQAPTVGAAASPPTAQSTPATPSPAPVQAPPSATAPDRIRIPAISIDSAVEPVGTQDRVLQIPPKPWVVGWWRDGVGFGTESGTIVLVAHLDSREYGTGPFARARSLVAGDRMTLVSEGRRAAYAVARVRTYLKTSLPYEELFRQSGATRVVLVTCGGQYRGDAGGWDSNVVVIFEPV